jgi:hypothetical protein
VSSAVDHFRGKILGCTAKTHGELLLANHFCKAVIDNLQVAIGINQDVLELKITMGNTLRMKVANCHNNLGSIELDNNLWESLLALENFVQLSTSNEGHDKVKAELRLEEIVHAHKEWVIAAKQDILLEFSVIHLIILEEHIFSDRLDSVQLLILLQLSEVDFTESTSTKDNNELEVLKLDILLLPGCDKNG